MALGLRRSRLTLTVTDSDDALTDAFQQTLRYVGPQTG
jgi:hypothetical protein